MRAVHTSFDITAHAGVGAHAGDGTVTVATDAAVNLTLNRAGTGFVTTAGWFGVSGHPNPAAIIGKAAVVVAELRAVWRAVRGLRATQVICLVDSRDALVYLRAWQTGEARMPEGYLLRAQRRSGNTSSLEQLAELLYYDGSRFTFKKVQAHIGHQLNETADSLARLGLRAGTRSGVPLDRVEDAARVIAAHRLGDYRAAAKPVTGRPA